MTLNAFCSTLLIKNKIVIRILTRDSSKCFSALLNYQTKKVIYNNYFPLNNYFTSPCLLKRRKTKEERKSPKIIEYPPKSKLEYVEIWHNMTVKELQSALGVNKDAVHLLLQGQQNGPIITDLKILQEAVRRCGYKPKMVSAPTTLEEKAIEKDVTRRPPAVPSLLRPRPPVVTVMGHVDHGKTTLLDALRHSSMVDKEFGGITQHIGAFTVQLKNGSVVTFLDTPGHAAFSAMRARGANVTDIVVLVVAADDGVMEQTLESIKMARQADVPLIVAVNKIDAPGADVARAERMLTEYGVMVESMGGDVQCIPVSALKRTNLQQLTEALVVQAEVLELNADPTGPVEAVVIESRVDLHRGKLCTAIVQRGTLTKGNVLVAGQVIAKVRSLRDADGNSIQMATPSQPVEIEGWRGLPSSGDLILQVESEKRARDVVRIREQMEQEHKALEIAPIIAAKMEKHHSEYQAHLQYKRSIGRFRLKDDKKNVEYDKTDESIPVLRILIKADVDGTLEAILNCFSTYNKSEECKLDLVNFGVGEVTENDIEMAKSFNSIVYTFNTGCSHKLKYLAEENEVEIRSFNVIYKLIDDVKAEITSRLPPKPVEENLGEASVLQIFTITDGKKKVPIAGSMCTKGLLKRNAKFRLLRNNKVVYEGKLKSMRHLKNEVDVIKTNMECGLQLGDDCPADIQVGDVIACFNVKMETQITSWNPGF